MMSAMALHEIYWQEIISTSPRGQNLIELLIHFTQNNNLYNQEIRKEIALKIHQTLQLQHLTQHLGLLISLRIWTEENSVPKYSWAESIQVKKLNIHSTHKHILERNRKTKLDKTSSLLKINRCWTDPLNSWVTPPPWWWRLNSKKSWNYISVEILTYSDKNTISQTILFQPNNCIP